jgi:hypothetical protein
MIRDRQREKLYNWERKILDLLVPKQYTAPMTLQQCRGYVAHICTRLKYITPYVNFYKDSINCPTIAEIDFVPDWNIKISSDYPVSRIVLIHEVSHMPFMHRVVENHGPEFTGLYATNLSKFLATPLEKITRSLTEHGLSFKM